MRFIHRYVNKYMYTYTRPHVYTRTSGAHTLARAHTHTHTHAHTHIHTHTLSRLGSSESSPSGATPSKAEPLFTLLARSRVLFQRWAGIKTSGFRILPRTAGSISVCTAPGRNLSMSSWAATRDVNVIVLVVEILVSVDACRTES